MQNIAFSFGLYVCRYGDSKVGRMIMTGAIASPETVDTNTEVSLSLQNKVLLGL